MKNQLYKSRLMAKASELRQGQLSRDQIAIEQNAELLDEIQRTADREIAMDAMTRDWNTAMLVAEALERIKDDEYGICLECEEPISERRLNAIPWARFCIRCQEQADNNHQFELAKAA